jgi:hypothetical protein
LELKFGPLAAPDRERVLAASEPQLLLWGTRLLHAESLASVLADQS